MGGLLILTTYMQHKDEGIPLNVFFNDTSEIIDFFQNYFFLAEHQSAKAINRQGY